MLEFTRTIARSLVSAARGRRNLALANLALCHQVAVLQRQTKGPQLKNVDPSLESIVASFAGEASTPASRKDDFSTRTYATRKHVSIGSIANLHARSSSNATDSRDITGQSCSLIVAR